jgi:hypothetical protein
VRIRQHFDASRLNDVPGRVSELFAGFGLKGRISDGSRVAITAGSRGIADLVPILRAVVEAVHSAGGQPFVVPCMCSHGGGTAAGQMEVLEALGVTESSVGATIVSSMDVVDLGRSSLGAPVWMSRDLAAADAIIAINRVKPHTDFTGPIESGIAKMLVIGMGKHRGASEAHRLTIRHGYPAVISECAGLVLSRLPVLCAVAVIENQYEHTAELHLLKPGEILQREPELLARARRLFPLLPFDRLDCLIVDEIGKEISGAGMDSNVTGRLNICGSANPERPRITRIFVRDLTPASHGNATGIGMADFTTKRLLAAMDWEVTAVNATTSMTPEDARLPIAFAHDAAAVEAAYMTSGAASIAEFELAWIRNTLALDQLLVSEALLSTVRLNPALEILDGPFPFPVDEHGGLLPQWWQ